MKSDYLEFEDKFLSPYATKSINTKGRVHPIEECILRTDFQRDRDRILHCKSFRRLKHKTQVFLSPNGDHYRTRLTHTLEVTQIARTIARALRLNEDLTEAIALGHDLGHTPFGHAGEKVLNKLSGHFSHNEQSLRVVERLELDGEGLNLTFEVRDGILNHKKSGNPCTLEGKVVSYADRIAYLNHDIDDAIRAKILKEEDLPSSLVSILGASRGIRINALITDIINFSYNKSVVALSPKFEKAMDELRDFMFETVYITSNAKIEETKAIRMLELLYNYFLLHPELVPEIYKTNTDKPSVYVSDYIASMSDIYAIRIFNQLFVPNSWNDELELTNVKN